ncbi:SET domain-containing protein [Rhodocollybia butyracea]|uniref:SET domain-containing protein n=1 Tax=Rhodocollybia butyracea TaxID=206335 RepID=A0A9P5Q2B7_9AGAR|nr:SET domain-containing protein [Rhodocollybia butyracea]
MSLIKIAKWSVWDTVLPPIRQPAYEISEVEGKGVGMVATRRIRAGELLVNERPVYAQRKRIARPIDYTDTNGYFYLGAVNGLAQASQNAIYALKNSFGPETHELLGILRTNFLTHDIAEEPDPANDFVGIFPTISRVNHSCTPNSNYYFSFGTFSGELRAIRDVEAGEEITIMYVNIAAQGRVRRSWLKEDYFFACGCNTCTVSDAEAAASDGRRTQVGRIIRTLEMNPSEAPLSQLELQDGLNMAKAEGLVVHYAQILWYGAARLARLNKRQLAADWLKRAKREYLIIEGECSPTSKALRMIR